MAGRTRDAALGSIKARIADKIRHGIQEGTYAPGAALPSTSALAKEEDAAAMTVRAAYDELIAEGLVVAVPRRGFFVREQMAMTWSMNAWQDPARLDILPVDAWTADVEAAGYRGRQEISLGIVGTDHRVAGHPLDGLLDLEETDRIAVRWRTRYIIGKSGEEPESLANSYYPYSLVKDSEICSDRSVNTAVVLKRLGAGLARYVDELTPRIATPEEAQRLQLPPSTAVLDLVRIGITSTGRRVLVQHMIRPGRGSKFVYHVTYPENP
jgi:DNA-binding GntR family transcriptional regulator